MTNVSNAGTTGALIGLMIGVIEYFVALLVMQKVVRKEISEAEEAREEMPGMASLGALVQKVKLVMILVAITLYPAIGYLAGRYLAV